VRFLGMGGWKGGIASPTGPQPDLGPRAGFYYRVIDKPGARRAGTCCGMGLAWLQPPPGPLHGETQAAQPPDTEKPTHPLPSPLLHPFPFWGPKGAFGGSGPGGYSQGLLPACPSCWKTSENVGYKAGKAAAGGEGEERSQKRGNIFSPPVVPARQRPSASFRAARLTSVREGKMSQGFPVPQNRRETPARAPQGGGSRPSATRHQRIHTSAAGREETL